MCRKRCGNLIFYNILNRNQKKKHEIVICNWSAHLKFDNYPNHIDCAHHLGRRTGGRDKTLIGKVNQFKTEQSDLPNGATFRGRYFNVGGDFFQPTGIVRKHFIAIAKSLSTPCFLCLKNFHVGIKCDVLGAIIKCSEEILL